MFFLTVLLYNTFIKYSIRNSQITATYQKVSYKNTFIMQKPAVSVQLAAGFNTQIP